MKSITARQQKVKGYTEIGGKTALAIATGLVLGTMTLTTYYVANYQTTWRSPIVIQNPVLVSKRTPERVIEYVEVYKEATPSAQVLEVSTQSSTTSNDLFDKYFGADADVARAIAMAESGLNSQAINHQDGHRGCTGSYGTFQIACLHTKTYGVTIKDLLDEETNIRIASDIYKKQGWTPWGAYTNGSYRKFL